MSRREVACLLVLLLASAWNPCYTQQVDCTVQVNYEAVGTTQKDLLQDFERDVREYINGYTWGSAELGEKIRCTMNIFVKSATGDDKYTAQVFIGSLRPILNSDRNSAVVRLFDENWEFTYVRTRPLHHNLFQFDELATFLDFYILLIIGSDFDTYEPGGGAPYFRNAADLANLARSSGGKGWDSKSGSFSRLQLIDEILNPKYEPIRKAIFTYHFAGLDSLATNPTRAAAAMFQALETIGRVRRQVDPQNLYIKGFFEAKYLEIAEVFQGHPDPRIYERLAAIDPPHRSTYEEAASRKK